MIKNETPKVNLDQGKHIGNYSLLTGLSKHVTDGGLTLRLQNLRTGEKIQTDESNLGFYNTGGTQMSKTNRD